MKTQDTAELTQRAAQVLDTLAVCLSDVQSAVVVLV